MPKSKIGRNDKCPCGSGLKYKKCCLHLKKSIFKNPLPHHLESSDKFKNMADCFKKNGFKLLSMQKIPDEWPELSKDEKEIVQLYLPICSHEEIKRLLRPSTISDELLQLRADSIVSNIRILRTFHKRAGLVKESDWSLMKQFDDSIFQRFKIEINGLYNHKIDEVYFGTIFSSKPQAYIKPTRYKRPLIIIPEALNKFLYFMNLGFYDLWNFTDTNVLEETKGQSILLAIRTMLSYEAFDFELDPRGNIPQNVNDTLEKVTEYFMLFIISHEYAHFLLDHLDSSDLIAINLFDDITPDSLISSKNIEVFNHSQIEEFQADSFAIEILCGEDNDKKRIILLYTVLIMSYIDIYEHISFYINPTSPSKSHPSAKSRRDKFIEKGKEIWNDVETEIANSIVKSTESIRVSLLKHYRQHPNMFTEYGSIYLDQWKEDHKMDRVDY